MDHVANPILAYLVPLSGLNLTVGVEEKGKEKEVFLYLTQMIKLFQFLNNEIFHLSLNKTWCKINVVVIEKLKV